ncbi:MAG: RHS repeat-associated core domain-containing protein [Collimonas sp.]|uniref:RHS repeat domain-containing protein n=1 Tax=Collimonas sp. TaxID=1963772 RepID=UPI003267A811
MTSVAIAYGRRFPDPSPLLTQEDRDKQAQILLTLTRNAYTNAVHERDAGYFSAYRTPVPCEAQLYELVNFKPERNLPDITNFFSVDEISRQVASASDGAHDLPFEDWRALGAKDGVPCRRLLKHSRNLYRSNQLDRLLPLGVLESLALPGESYTLAFTPSLLAEVFKRPSNDTAASAADPPPAPETTSLLPDPSAVLGSTAADGGGYVDLKKNGCWWMPHGKVFFHTDPAIKADLELAQAKRHFFLPRRFESPFGINSTADFDKHDFLTSRTADALNNTVRADNDYRVLQPQLITDPNGNRSEVMFDTLGLVAGSAVMGKTTENIGDNLDNFRADLTMAEIELFFADPKGPLAAELLHQASTRIVYNPDAFYRTRKPAFTATLARETHSSDLLPGQHAKMQISFSYADGFGREIQKKIQAEPEPSAINNGAAQAPRWIGSGWTIYNNKGKPVRQYEPFFDDTNDFKFGNRIGVSPIQFYDPVGRKVASVSPNHTWQKSVFDPWRQEDWDVNDTVLIGHPQEDHDAGEYFRRLPEAAYLPSWHDARIAGSLGNEEQSAARKAAVHAATPNLAYADVLGRAALRIAHNRRIERFGNGRDAEPVAEFYATRVLFDIQGNQRIIIDASNRSVIRYDFDLHGNRLRQASMEAGTHWFLNDVSGKAIRIWDSRGQQFRNGYDALRRPTEAFLSAGGSDSAELLIGRTVYGESKAQPETRNMRGKAVQICDQAGVVSSDDYDFKGNLLHSQRQLACEYKRTLDWSGAVPLETPRYVSRTRYDALNRPIELTHPDLSIVHPSYNAANLLDSVAVHLRGAQAPTPFIRSIHYNAKGQRTLLEYGNGARSRYQYDALTFRLTAISTHRSNQEFPGRDHLQQLRYTYDAAGNITHIRDTAQQSIYFCNEKIEPSNEYTYDAIYRLIEGRGREHLGLMGDTLASSPYSSSDTPRTGLPQPGDGKALARYMENYRYDAVGNLCSMRHRGNAPGQAGWKRDYIYHEASQLEPAQRSNRLSATRQATTLGETTESYGYAGSAGLHGNITAMPHLSRMQWNYRDQLQASAQQVIHLGVPETTWYVYDAGGQRLRKITERHTRPGEKPRRLKERIYIGAVEIYRQYNNDDDGVKLERETLHVMDDKQRIALVETRTQGNHENDPSPFRLIRYQISNHLGSSCLELDQQAQIISYEEYSPFGSTTYQAVRGQTDSPKRYRYAGKERDEENGFTYYGARYCASWLARWINPDPAGMVDGSNLYAYVRNNPLSYTDATGTECDPAMQSCVDPAESTPREESEQACIPEEHPASEAPQDAPAASGNATDAPGAPADPALNPAADAPQDTGFQVRGYDGEIHTFNTYDEASSFSQADDRAHDPGTWERFKRWVNTPDPFAGNSDRLGAPGLVTVGAVGVIVTGTGTVVVATLARLAPVARVAAVASVPLLVKSSDDAEGMSQVATIASFGIGGPATASESLIMTEIELNRAKELGLAFYDVAEPGIQATLSAPRLPVTFSTVTRNGVTVINVNNPRVYQAFLEATEEGAVALRPGEFVGSPPISSGAIPHPDWRSSFIHAETQGERELSAVFDLNGPGIATSYPNPGCGFCVPWLASRGIVHLNPKPVP